MRNLFPYNAIMRCKLSNSFIRLSLRTFPPITYNEYRYQKSRNPKGLRDLDEARAEGWIWYRVVMRPDDPAIPY